MTDAGQRKFVMLYKDIALNARLSMQARALYAVMRGQITRDKQDREAISLVTLMKDTGWGGKGTIYLYLDELIAAGLVIVHRGRRTQATVYEMTDTITEGFSGHRRARKMHGSFPGNGDHMGDQVVDHPYDQVGDHMGDHQVEIVVDHPCDQVVDHPCDQVVDHTGDHLLIEEKELEKKYQPPPIHEITTTGKAQTTLSALADTSALPSTAPMPYPLDAPTRRRSVSWRYQDEGRGEVNVIQEQGGICSDPSAVVAPAPEAVPVDVDVDVNGRPLNEIQRYFKYWGEKMGILDKKMTPDTASRMGKTFKQMKMAEVMPEDLPDLIDFHRSVRGYLYERGNIPEVWQVAEVIANWQASKEHPDTAGTERESPYLANLRRSLMA